MKKHHYLLIFTINLIVSLPFTGYSSYPDRAILEKRVDSIISVSLQPTQPGGIVGLVHNGTTIFSKAYGMADLEKQNANTLNHTFNLASVAKHFTAYAVLMLEQEGKLSLDDRVHNYVSCLPDYGHEVTIRHLLHHTSGIASTDLLRLVSNKSFELPWEHSDELDIICRYPVLNFAPGEDYVYSNAGYSLLASIIEKTSGMSYADYLQQRIFEPLGMNSTFIYDHHGKKIPDMAAGHEKKGEDFLVSETPADAAYGGSNVYTSAGDMAIWANHYLRGNMDISQKIFTSRHSLNNGDTINYSYGMYVTTHNGLKLVSHSGGDLGYRAQFWVFPDQQVVIFAAFNTDAFNTRNLVNSIAGLYLSEHMQIEKPKQRIAIDLEAETLEKYTGDFSMANGMQLTFNLERDTLWLIIPDAPHFPMFAETSNHFFLKAFNAQVTFLKGENGSVDQIMWHQGGSNTPGHRAKPTVLPQGEELRLYAGNYFHEALGTEYPVEFADNELILHTPETFQRFLGIGNVKLTPIGDDYFIAGPLEVLVFTRDKNNRISGFILKDFGRLKNFELKRKQS